MSTSIFKANRKPMRNPQTVEPEAQEVRQADRSQNVVGIDSRTERPSWGGSRTGSGRPPKGNVQFLIRVKPTTRQRIKSLAEAKSITPGELIEELLGGR